MWMFIAGGLGALVLLAAILLMSGGSESDDAVAGTTGTVAATSTTQADEPGAGGTNDTVGADETDTAEDPPPADDPDETDEPVDEYDGMSAGLDGGTTVAATDPEGDFLSPAELESFSLIEQDPPAGLDMTDVVVDYVPGGDVTVVTVRFAGSFRDLETEEDRTVSIRPIIDEDGSYAFEADYREGSAFMSGAPEGTSVSAEWLSDDTIRFTIEGWMPGSQHSMRVNVFSLLDAGDDTAVQGDRITLEPFGAAPGGDDDPNDEAPQVRILYAILAPGSFDGETEATMRLSVQNVGNVPWTATVLADDVLGDLLGPNPGLNSNTCNQVWTLAPFEVKKCEYTFTVDATMAEPFSFDPNPSDTDDTEVDVEAYVTGLDITVRDDDGDTATANQVAFMVQSTNIIPLEIDKTAEVNELASPDVVEFTVTITHRGQEQLSILGLDDDTYGDLLDVANARVSASTCPELPPTIGPTATLVCRFTAPVGSNTETGDHRDEVAITVANARGDLAVAIDDEEIAIEEPGPAP